MSSSKETTQNTVTTQQLSDEQQQILDLAMPSITEWAATTPERYQGDQVADLTDAQVTGQNMALAAADSQNQIASNAQNTYNYWTSDAIWDPANNSALQGAIDAAVRPVTTNYQTVVMPQVRDTYENAGQIFGGSRRNLSEVGAADKYLTNVGETSSKLVNENYQTNVNAQLKALGLTSDIQNAQSTGAVTASAVGDVQQAQNQAEIDQEVENWNYDQLAPLLQSQELVSLLSSIPGGTTVSNSTGTTTGGTGSASSVLGGAAAGATLGSYFGPAGTAAGAGLGGLMTYLT